MGNRLGELDLHDISPPPKRRKKKHPSQHRGEPRTRARNGARNRERLPAVVPKNKSLSEIAEMDEQDPAFRHPQGRPRKTIDENSSWKEIARRDKQGRANRRRGIIRKWEAQVEVAARVLQDSGEKEQYGERGKPVTMDDRAVAEGMLDMADWSIEELIRGYRHDRNGKFGKAPKYIPREVQQACFRALLGRTDKRLRAALMDSVEELVSLAREANSEKVRLDAIKELQNRVIGKVPERVHVAQDQPWEGILADSLVPMGGEALPLDLEMDDYGIAALPPGREEDWVETDGDGVVAPADSAAAAESGPAHGTAPPSPVISEVKVIPGRLVTRTSARRARER